MTVCLWFKTTSVDIHMICTLEYSYQESMQLHDKISLKIQGKHL